MSCSLKLSVAPGQTWALPVDIDTAYQEAVLRLQMSGEGCYEVSDRAPDSGNSAKGEHCGQVVLGEDPGR